MPTNRTGLRTNLLFCALIFVCAGVVFGNEVAAASTVYGIHSDSSPILTKLYSFDDQTGTVSLIGSTGVALLPNLATSPSGTLYSLGGTTGDQLVTINPATGAATTVVTLSYSGTAKPNANPQGLAFSPTGALFDVASTNGQTNIYRIDPTTGVTTMVGNTGTTITPFGDLAFSPSGTLYGINLGQGLMTINQTTGVATPVRLTGFRFQDMAFRSDGTLWAAVSEGGGGTWMNINLATGAATPTGFSFNPPGDVQGIQFAPVPVPAALWLFGSGLAAMVGFARNRTAS